MSKYAAPVGGMFIGVICSTAGITYRAWQLYALIFVYCVSLIFVEQWALIYPTRFEEKK